MQPGDRTRILRGLGLGVGSLLLLSGAVFASQSGTRPEDHTQAATTSSPHDSESPEASGSPDVEAVLNGVVEDANSSPEESPENDPGDDNGQDQDEDASPSAAPSADEGTDDQANVDDNSGPGGGDDRNEGSDDNSGPGSDDSGHRDGSDD